MKILLAVTTRSVALLLSLPAAQSAQTPQIVWKTNAAVHAVAFSTDGSLVGAGGNDSLARVWRLSDRSLAQRVQVSFTTIHSLAIAPDNSSFVTGSDDNGIRRWDINTGRLLWSGGVSEGLIYSLVYSSDGRLLGVGRNAAYYVFEIDSLKGVFIEKEVRSPSVAFSSSGTWFAAAMNTEPIGYYPATGVVKVYRMADSAVQYALTDHSNAVYSVDFSPDGQLLLTTSLDGTARLWRVSDGSAVRVIEGGGGVFGKFSADGKSFFTCDGIGTVDFIPGSGTIKFWRTSDGALLASFNNLGAGPIAVNPAGKYFAYGKGDGSLVVAYIPLWIESITQSGGKITLHWQGGSGRYQVQARPHVDKGDWHNHGPVTTNTTFTHSAHSPLFYRVQSLPNPL